MKGVLRFRYCGDLPKKSDLACRLALLAVSCGAAVPALAAEADSINADLGYSVQHDSNLFRLPDAEHPVIDGVQRDRSDSSRTGEVGASLTQAWGRQHFYANAAVLRTEYSDFDYLDYTATNYRVAWDWGLGKRWLGILSASQSEAERSFADFFATTRSVNTYRSYVARADFRMLARWTAGAEYTKVTSSYDDVLSSAQDYGEKAWEARITFRPASDNELALVARDADGEYPHRTDLRVVDSEYTQRDVRLEGKYSLTIRSVVSGYLGIAHRTYPRTSFRDFSGPIGRVNYDWALTQRLQLGLQLRRELGAQEDLTDTYVVTTAAGLKLDWQCTTRIGARLWSEKQTRDYGGNPGLGVVPLNGQKDDQLVYGFGLKYLPIRKLEISASYQRDSRERNNAFGKYSNGSTRVEATFRY